MAGSVRRAVQSGDYTPASEVIGEAVREWQERRSLLGFTADDLRALAEEGRDSGPATLNSMDEIKAEARRRFERQNTTCVKSSSATGRRQT